MAIKRISNLHDWELVHDEQDIRGWKMKDATGDTIGTVSDLVADTDQKLVTTVILDDGREFPAREVEIADGVVYARGTYAGTPDGPVVKVYDDARLRQGAAAATPVVFSTYADEFRTHHTTNYGDTGHDYDVFDPAYRAGFDYGVDDQYGGRDYDALEPDMRRSYEERHGEGTWEKVKDAARHAFHKARNLGDDRRTDRPAATSATTSSTTATRRGSMT